MWLVCILGTIMSKHLDLFILNQHVMNFYSSVFRECIITSPGTKAIQINFKRQYITEDMKTSLPPIQLFFKTMNIKSCLEDSISII